MRPTARKIFFICLCVLVSLPSFVSSSLSRDASLLEEGIKQYQQENYEEAAEILTEARRQDPQSSSAAFFLGLAYKQMILYPKALENFRDAVTLKPGIREALVEIIDVAFELGKIEEAKRWVAVAEEEKVSAPKVAFLKGRILGREGKNLEAIGAFEKAAALDSSLSQPAEFQIALCYMREKDLEKAKERFRAAVVQDPESDLGSFARQYQDMVEKRIELARPLRITLSLFEQYNTNLLSNPSEPGFAAGNTDEGVFSTVPSLQVHYAPELEAPWLFTAQYAFSGALHDEYATSRDSVSNSISIVPGYNFGRFSLNVATRYSYSVLRDSSYKSYSDSLSIGPMVRIALAENHMLELFGGYDRKEYFQPPTRDEEDRDSTGYRAYISWIWTFKETFLNLRYEYVVEDTDGEWWDNEGHKFSANALIPLFDKVQMQLSGQVFLQDYRNNHILLHNRDARNDETYTGSVGLTWEFMKNTSLVLQYTKIEVDSNIGYYEYDQEIYSTGLEYRY